MTQAFNHKTDFNNVSQRTGKGIDSPLDAEGHTALHVAVRKGDVAAATRLLQLHANPHHPTKAGQPPIFEAVATHNTKMVRLLLEYGATFRVEDDAKRTPLMWAIEQKCDTAFLRQLVDLGCVLDQQTKSGRQPLHAAAAANRPEIIEYLAKNGALMDQADNEGKTALHLAVESGAHAALKKLIVHGANPVIRTKEIKTALYIAAASGDMASIDILLEQPIVRQTLNEFRTYAEGWNPLMAAIINNRIEVVEKLASTGADLSQRDNQNRLPLYFAVENGYAKIVEILLRHGADVERGPKPATNAQPMLHRICSSNPANQAAYGEILLMLYTAGANLDITDGSGATALYRAADIRESYKIKPLLELGANPNQPNNYGQRPIDTSMAMARWAYDTVRDTVAQLLAHRADANIAPAASVQSSPLHLAIASGRKELVELLLNYNVVVDEPERNTGSTAWMLALENRNLDIAELLRQKGADTTRKDRWGKSVLHVAASSGFKDLLEKSLTVPAMKAQIDAMDTYTSTPLHYATRLQKPDCAAVLLNAGANAELVDGAGLAALHHAVSSNSEALLAIFEGPQAKKTNWNVQSRDDRETPLHIAIRRNFTVMIDRLLKQNLDLTVRNKQGQTPLTAAINADQAAIVTSLATYMKAKKISFSEQRDAAGLSAMHIAALRWTPVIMNSLLDAGAEINVRTPEGDTPLHTAARNGRLESAKMLLTRGADVMLANNAGASPLDLAIAAKNEQMITLMAQAVSERRATQPGNKPPQP
jgi:serine/threonine-protein phosphatase 6 regulatory ankyrin repeat subunit C